MLKIISAAVIAASLIAGPALAQSVNTGVNANTSATVSTPAAGAKTNTNANVKVKATRMKKAKKHSMLMIKHRRHFAHVTHVKRHAASVHGKMNAKVHAKLHARAHVKRIAG